MAFPFEGLILKTVCFIFNIITFKITNTHEGMAHSTTYWLYFWTFYALRSFVYTSTSTGVSSYTF